MLRMRSASLRRRGLFPAVGIGPQPEPDIGDGAGDERESRSNGLLLAHRGHLTEARGTGLAQVRESAERGQGGPADIGRFIVAMADLFGGDYAAAMSDAQTVIENDPAYTAEVTLPELIEATVRAGDHEAAATAHKILSERALAAGTPWALGLRPHPGDRRRPHASGSAGSGPRRGRSVGQRNRRADVHQPEHRRLSPPQGVPQAQRDVPDAARRPPKIGTRRRRPPRCVPDAAGQEPLITLESDSHPVV